VRAFTGTSGFSYPAWKGSFYPADLPGRRMLEHYARRLLAVEANATFYRVPRPQTLASWRAAVPPGFLFALKAPQRVTHVLKLRDAGGLLRAFYRATAELGPALGAVLYQLPPRFRKDLPLLEDFLSELPAGGRTAFEFRHASWFSDDLYELLRAHGVALCTADVPETPAVIVPTCRLGYLRLRRPDYSPPALRSWAERILAQPWDEAVVFFKHEDGARGPVFARELQLLLGVPPRAIPPSGDGEEEGRRAADVSHLGETPDGMLG
jgi:uncharacterized protein YecE (DUF72 family)